MLIYGILMLIAGAITYWKAARIENEIVMEEDEQIRRELVKSVRKRRNTATVLFVLGGVLAVGSIIMLATL